MDISIRELKANPAAAIARMQQGERVRITSHRKVVAELVPPGGSAGAAAPAQEPVLTADEAAAIARLMASGLITEPATEAWRLPQAVTLPASPDGKTMSDLVIEGRGPR